MRNYDLTVSNVILDLTVKKPISFLRYGDGEFMCMLQEIYGRKARATNCDRHDYTLPLALDLLHVLREAPLVKEKAVRYGMQDPKFLASLMGIPTEEAIRMVDEMSPGAVWFHGDFLHRASIAGELAPFLRAFLARTPVLVGPPIFKKLDQRIKRNISHIEIPSLNCYDSKATIKGSIYQCYKRGHRTFSISASMAAKPIIHELAPLMPEASLLDLGSLWDVFCGAPSRSYHKKMSKETIERNLAL